MAKKRNSRQRNRLPSGSYRVRAYDYTDENGTRHYRSFTAAARTEAEELAREWKERRDRRPADYTVREACEKYIALKSSVLSPSTVYGYGDALKRIAAHPIGRTALGDVDSAAVQVFVSDLSGRLAPKTVANTYGLLSVALSMFAPGLDISVTLPSPRKPELYTPSTADVQALIDCCRSAEMKLAVVLAAVGSLRRGEIAALERSDLRPEDGTISVTKSMVRKSDGGYGGTIWETKSPKTPGSTRTVGMPEYVFRMAESLPDDRPTLLGLNPIQISERFTIARRDAGLEKCRFHDLRHYSASYMHAIGMPDRYIEARGGWKPGSTVLKRVYENVIDIELKRQEKMLLESQGFTV